MGARVPISTCFLLSDRVLFASARASCCTRTFSYAFTRSQYMFSIWSTVVIICSRNATSVISRLFLAKAMKRLLGVNPKPCSKCWFKVALKLEPRLGLNDENGLSLVIRELFQPTVRLVPH